MREIEFRGKTVLENEWVYGFYYNTDDCRKGNRRHIIIRNNNGPGWSKIEELVIPETVSQYIGIKDIHDTKVFQGDIVKVKRNIYTDCNREELYKVEEYIGEVVLIQYGWCIAEKIENGIKYHNLWPWGIGWKDDDTMEILGNRWDNPEMAVIDLTA